jgi:hypothetical protein
MSVVRLEEESSFTAHQWRNEGGLGGWGGGGARGGGGGGGGAVQQIQLRTEGRENGYLGAVAP